MLTPQDDHIGHQLPTTFDHVGTSDPAWMERYWYTGHLVPSGEALFDLGLGYHPNRNVMDAFAGVTVGSRQYNFRASRQLRPNPLNPLHTKIGPLEFAVLEGFRRHRLSLDENESGISFDIEFRGGLNPHEEAQRFRRRNGRITENLARCQQLGRYAGWLKVDGRRYELTPETWCGQRDHSWGIRAELRTDETQPPLTHFQPSFWTWVAVQFPQRGLLWSFTERAPGDIAYLTGEEVLPLGQRASRGLHIGDVKHELVWAKDSLGQTLESGTFELTLANGKKRQLELRTLPARYFLKGGLYGGLKGWFQGDDKGPLHLEYERWDLRDAATRRLARTLADHVVQVREGDEVGYGIIEYAVAPGYPKYQEVQQFPPY